MELYHFSEEPGIARFEPRPMPVERRQGREVAAQPRVWAIDAAHAPLYYFPRDCPRIVLWTLPTSTEADQRRWLGASTARFVAHVEWEWLDRVRSTTLYRYALPAVGFEPLHDHGVHVSRSAVAPLRVEPLPDLLAALGEADVELRVVASLAALREVWASTLHASGIRLANSRGWPR